jgi:PAS domain-containing protein
LKRHRLRILGESVPGLYSINIIRKDGIKVSIELTGAFTTYQNKPANVLYIRDITERKKIQSELEKYQYHLEKLVRKRTNELKRELDSHKQTEVALKASENRYHSLFQNVPVAIFEVDYSKAKIYLSELKKKGIKKSRNILMITKMYS